MPKYRLKNTIDCEESHVMNLIKGTNGEHFVAGWRGHGEKFKANTPLIFEVICENKPCSDKRITWEEQAF